MGKLKKRVLYGTYNPESKESYWKFKQDFNKVIHKYDGETSMTKSGKLKLYVWKDQDDRRPTRQNKLF